MSFKIVQTVEQNRTFLTIVPSKWERNGTLFWTTHRNEVKLIYDENSSPKPDWKKIQCGKKRELSTLQEAENELQIMEQASDTDADHELSFQNPVRSKARTLNSTRLLPNLDFNNQVISDQNLSLVTEGSQEDVTEVQNSNIPVLLTVTDETTYCANPPGVVGIEVSTSKCSGDSEFVASTGSYVNTTESQVLLQLLANQQQMMQQMAIMQASIDVLMGQTTNVKKHKQDFNRISFKPINSKKELDETESKLKDEGTYNNIVSEMAFVCGDSGNRKGANSCYKLIDYFFTREIFLSCNWTGSTRDNTANKKIPLKFYTNVRNCLLEIVRKSDKNFTENECEKFFKILIKNAKQRLANKHDSTARVNKPRDQKKKVHPENTVEECQVDLQQEVEALNFESKLMNQNSAQSNTKSHELKQIEENPVTTTTVRNETTERPEIIQYNKIQKS